MMSPRLGSVRPREFIAKMKRAGFWVDRQRGSHVILLNESGVRLSVPMHAREMKRGLLMGLIKMADLSVEEFEEL